MRRNQASRRAGRVPSFSPLHHSATPALPPPPTASGRLRALHAANRRCGKHLLPVRTRVDDRLLRDDRRRADVVLARPDEVGLDGAEESEGHDAHHLLMVGRVVG